MPRLTRTFVEYDKSVNNNLQCLKTLPLYNNNNNNLHVISEYVLCAYKTMKISCVGNDVCLWIVANDCGTHTNAVR